MGKPNWEKELRKIKWCIICGREGHVDFHHFSKGVNEPGFLIPLCPNCHRDIHEDGFSAKQIFKVMMFLCHDQILAMFIHNSNLENKKIGFSMKIEGFKKGEK